jgi:hypothetical protein
MARPTGNGGGRKRTRIYESLNPSQQQGRSYESLTLGEGQRAVDRSSVSRQNPAAAFEEERSRTRDTEFAVEAARLGDDSVLLPYQPTPSINPPRPRTVAAGYDRETQTLRVRFRDGTPWAYYDVPPRVWNNFKRVKSPGRFINRVLNNYPYARDDF